jgi:hypothetical protein
VGFLIGYQEIFDRLLRIEHDILRERATSAEFVRVVAILGDIYRADRLIDAPLWSYLVALMEQLVQERRKYPTAPFSSFNWQIDSEILTARLKWLQRVRTASSADEKAQVIDALERILI